jgi:hypothetical protein
MGAREVCGCPSHLRIPVAQGRRGQSTISLFVLLPSVDAKTAESRSPQEVALRTRYAGRALADDLGYGFRPLI